MSARKLRSDVGFFSDLEVRDVILGRGRARVTSSRRGGLEVTPPENVQNGQNAAFWLVLARKCAPQRIIGWSEIIIFKYRSPSLTLGVSRLTP